MKVSVVTLVNNPDMYNKNVIASLNSEDVEFVSIYNPVSASSGLNEGIKKSSNNMIVICHQDVIFSENWVKKLEEQIKLVNDNNFGVLGTFGARFEEHTNGVGNVRSGDKELQGYPLPCLVQSLDEHCLIIRKDGGLIFDETLIYFHMYAADLCLTAYHIGMNCYAIDARVHHLSDNVKRDENFQNALAWFINKWRGKSKLKKLRTSCCMRIDLE